MECKDPKCPIHGHLKTHGNEIEGVVVSDKAKKTVIVEHAYTTFLKKYERSLRKTSRIAAYSPAVHGGKDRRHGDHRGHKEAQQDKVICSHKSINKNGVI